MEAVQKEEGNKTYLLYAMQSKNEDLRGNVTDGLSLLYCKLKKKFFPGAVLVTACIYCGVEYTCME